MFDFPAQGYSYEKIPKFFVDVYGALISNDRVSSSNGIYYVDVIRNEYVHPIYLSDLGVFVDYKNNPVDQVLAQILQMKLNLDNAYFSVDFATQTEKSIDDAVIASAEIALPEHVELDKKHFDYGYDWRIFLLMSRFAGKLENPHQIMEPRRFFPALAAPNIIHESSIFLLQHSGNTLEEAKKIKLRSKKVVTKETKIASSDFMNIGVQSRFLIEKTQYVLINVGLSMLDAIFFHLKLADEFRCATLYSFFYVCRTVMLVLKYWHEQYVGCISVARKRIESAEFDLNRFFACFSHFNCGLMVVERIYRDKQCFDNDKIQSAINHFLDEDYPPLLKLTADVFKLIFNCIVESRVDRRKIIFLSIYSQFLDALMPRALEGNSTIPALQTLKEFYVILCTDCFFYTGNIFINMDSHSKDIFRSIINICIELFLLQASFFLKNNQLSQQTKKILLSLEEAAQAYLVLITEVYQKRANLSYDILCQHAQFASCHQRFLIAHRDFVHIEKNISKDFYQQKKSFFLSLDPHQLLKSRHTFVDKLRGDIEKSQTFVTIAPLT